jgi:hypothetical protein
LARARAFLLLRTRRRLAEELKKRREGVLKQVEELASLYETDRQPAGFIGGGRDAPRS